MNRWTFISLIAMLFVTGLLLAQTASGTATVPSSCPNPQVAQGDHDGDGILNFRDEDFLKSRPGWRNRGNQVIGDGTRPAPRDGTGFGAKRTDRGQGNRQGLRNGQGRCQGQGQGAGQGLRNGQGRGRGQGQGSGQGLRNGQGGGLRKRDGSCLNGTGSTTTTP